MLEYSSGLYQWRRHHGARGVCRPTSWNGRARGEHR